MGLSVPNIHAAYRKIDMLKAVDGREFYNVAGFRCSYGATVRRVATQGLVCSQRMVVNGSNCYIDDAVQHAVPVFKRKVRCGLCQNSFAEFKTSTWRATSQPC